MGSRGWGFGQSGSCPTRPARRSCRVPEARHIGHRLLTCSKRKPAGCHFPVARHFFACRFAFYSPRGFFCADAAIVGDCWGMVEYPQWFPPKSPLPGNSPKKSKCITTQKRAWETSSFDSPTHLRGTSQQTPCVGQPHLRDWSPEQLSLTETRGLCLTNPPIVLRLEFCPELMSLCQL